MHTCLALTNSYSYSTTMTDVWNHCLIWSTINHSIMFADPIATTVTRAQTVAIQSHCNGGN